MTDQNRNESRFSFLRLCINLVTTNLFELKNNLQVKKIQIKI